MLDILEGVHDLEVGVVPALVHDYLVVISEKRIGIGIVSLGMSAQEQKP